MGYLFTQILIWLLLAAALGLLVGWLLWGRRDELEKCLRDSRNLRSDLERTRAKLTQLQTNEESVRAADETANAELQAAKAESERLHAEVELARNALKANRDELESARSAVETETSGIRSELEKTKADLDACRGDLQAAQTEAESARSESANLRTELQLAQTELADCRASQADTPAPDATAVAKAQPPKPASTGIAPDAAEAPPEDWKPSLLSAPQGEKDDLKRIRGVGPKIEGILNDLGIYHFSQIAAFTEENVAWVNSHLKFKGRIERENWIEQAKQLASGG